MRYIFLILYAFIFSILISCKEIKTTEAKDEDFASSEQKDEKKDLVPKIYSKSLKKTGSLKIPIDLETPFYAENIQYVNTKDQELLVTLPLSSNTLNIYDLKSPNKNQIGKVILQAEGPNSVKGEVGAFYYHNKDSIFVLSKFAFEVFLVSNEGIVKDSYPLIKEYNSQLPIPMGSTFSPLKFLKNKLYISCAVPHQQFNGAYENSLLEYDIVKRKTFYKGANPDILNKGNWEGVARLYYDYDHTNEEFILAFSISDEIVKYSPPSQIKKFQVKSDYINSEKIKPFSTTFKKAQDYIERAKYSFSTPKYWGILHDKTQNNYYRIGIQSTSYANFSKGAEFPSTIIMVMDTNFNTILEHEMNATKYQFDMSFVGKNGLYIANKEQYNENDNFLTFDVFSVQ